MAIKKKVWTEIEARNFLEKRGAEIKGNFIFLNPDCGGLSGGSALDFLLNYCDYFVTVNRR